MRARLRVRVTPRAGRDAIDRLDAEGVLHLRVSAPPADGAANEAATRLLANLLGVPRSKVSIVAGSTARMKTLEVDGIDEPTMRTLLSAAEAAS